MDELGLGTKSTRHDIISKLYARAYVQGNPMRPTNTAYVVVDTLERYAPTITKGLTLNNLFIFSLFRCSYTWFY